MPSAGKVEGGYVIADSAVTEHITPIGGRCARCDNDIAPMAICLAFLGNYEASVEEHVTSAADKVDGAVYLAVLHIMLALLAVRVISILV